MIEGNDGGATVTFNGGATWSSIYNQPTAELYHVTTDTRTPYRLHGAQQDNTTISVPSRSPLAAITHAETTGRSAAAKAATSRCGQTTRTSSSRAATSGFLTRYDHRTGQARDIEVWPEDMLGGGRQGREVSLPVDLSDRCCRRTIRTCCT